MEAAPDSKTLCSSLEYRKGNIKMDLNNIACEGINRILLTLNRIQRQAFVNTIMNRGVQIKKGSFSIRWATVSLQ